MGDRSNARLEIAEQIRYVCPGVAVGCRISAEEHMEGGLTKEEMIDVAQDEVILKDKGVDLIEKYILY